MYSWYNVSMNRNIRFVVVVMVFSAITAIIGYFTQPNRLTPAGESLVGSKHFEVFDVVDGDTIKLDRTTYVRLIGIDAPESGECYYDEAKEVLMDLVKGNVVRLDEDIESLDHGGRMLRYVILEREGMDNVHVNDYMVRYGFAFDRGQSPNYRFRDTFREASESAKRENEGIWAECNYDKDIVGRQKSVLPTEPGCLIKGNVSDNGLGRLYHAPECDSYRSVKVDPARGENYFCTVKEAEEAGFMRAGNCP